MVKMLVFAVDDIFTFEELCGSLNLALENISFKNVYFGFAKPLPCPEYSVPLNFRSRLTVPLEGPCPIVASFDGRVEKKILNPGDILFTGRNGWAYGQIHQSDDSQTVSVVFMDSYVRLVKSEKKSGVTVRNPWRHTSAGPDGVTLLLLQALNVIMHETETDRQARALPLLIALIRQVLLDVSREPERKTGKAERTFQMILEQIHQRFNETITRKSICAELGLNESYASALFKRKTGENINTCLNRTRMDMADFLLKNYDEPVERISRQCGFSSAGYFIKSFKKFYGVTPGALREAEKRQGAARGL
jgi:AraC-like DNA-binding protein